MGIGRNIYMDKVVCFKATQRGTCTFDSFTYL